MAEACASDGTLPLYRAALGVIHNISRDHGELSALRPQFEAFAANSRAVLVKTDSWRTHEGLSAWTERAGAAPQRSASG